ncbi:hypothetical protein B0H16DRAFT_1602228 [Mycena metata]|uniref:Uncharacterized protein n=1 Tax=Mycena metata TaxID=1033252 RepID=A0AAD7HJS3_9AGAR|nr:hypothetical protein B0H16DRAFT_1602228 [Mycena metata]
MKPNTLYHHASFSWLQIMPLTTSLITFIDAAVYHSNTLWLFTKSDFMTTMIPISLFAIVAAPLTSLRNLPHLVFWLWFHLLHFNTSDQTASFEDETNKPDRPLPAGRITLHTAVLLRWTLMPMCWALSLAYSKEVMFSSMALSVFTGMYNELGGSGSHFVFRYALNGLGFAAFEAGTALVAKEDKTFLDSAGWLTIFLSGSIFATTIYAQVVGDSISRTVLLCGVVAWSIGLSYIWKLDL